MQETRELRHLQILICGFAISDDAHKQLWETNRTPLLEGLGEYLPLLPLDFGFVRVFNQAGVVVELLAYKTSELDGLEAYEWKFLLCRLSTGEPRFKKFPERSPAEMWPDMQELSVDSVRQLANNHMLYQIWINRLLIRRRSPLSLILEKELVAFRSGTGISTRTGATPFYSGETYAARHVLDFLGLSWSNSCFAELA